MEQCQWIFWEIQKSGVRGSIFGIISVLSTAKHQYFTPDLGTDKDTFFSFNDTVICFQLQCKIKWDIYVLWMHIRQNIYWYQYV
jgi:hypothetical protein